MATATASKMILAATSAAALDHDTHNRDSTLSLREKIDRNAREHQGRREQLNLLELKGDGDKSQQQVKGGSDPDRIKKLVTKLMEDRNKEQQQIKKSTEILCSNCLPCTCNSELPELAHGSKLPRGNAEDAAEALKKQEVELTDEEKSPGGSDIICANKALKVCSERHGNGLEIAIEHTHTSAHWECKQMKRCDVDKKSNEVVSWEWVDMSKAVPHAPRYPCYSVTLL
jgi:hypothetical protein